MQSFQGAREPSLEDRLSFGRGTAVTVGVEKNNPAQAFRSLPAGAPQSVDFPASCQEHGPNVVALDRRNHRFIEAVASGSIAADTANLKQRGATGVDHEPSDSARLVGQGAGGRRNGLRVRITPHDEVDLTAFRGAEP